MRREELKSGGLGIAAACAALVLLGAGVAEAQEIKVKPNGGGTAVKPRQGNQPKIKPKPGKGKGKPHGKKPRRKGDKPRMVEPAPRSPVGPYALFGVGLSGVEVAGDGFNRIDPGPGLTLGLGYRITELLGVEGNFLFSFHGARQVQPGITTGTSVSATLLAGEVDLKLHFPLGERLEGYGLVSGGYADLSANRTVANSQSGFTLGLGFGLGYTLLPHMSIGLRAQAANHFFEEEIETSRGRETPSGDAFIYQVMPTLALRF